MHHNNLFQVYNASAGSGKTFTIVKEYLKIVLSSKNPKTFQKILAVTFTNKAANELKERVLNSLESISKKEISTLFSILKKELNLNSDELCYRAQLILETILNNYSSFSITTLDSFTYRIIRTFVFDLNLPANFDVELNAKQVLHEAVEVLISKIGTEPQLTNIVTDFVIRRLEDNKSADISNELNKFSELLLNENHSNHLNEIKNISIKKILTYQKELQGKFSQLINQLRILGEKGLNLIRDNGLNDSDFLRGQIPNFFKKLMSDPLNKISFSEDSAIKRNIENRSFYKKATSKQIADKIDNCMPKLLNYFNEAEKLFTQLLYTKTVGENLSSLALLSEINKALNEVKLAREILLNAEFNEKIYDTIKDEPAPFIYERLGNKYSYFFIDEMQDTSVLQWRNLIPLLDHALSIQEDGSSNQLTIVGDAKQSIYRWRGGKPEQFIKLSVTDNSNAFNPFAVEKITQSLPKNYRSYSEIIQFNNQFFTAAASYLNKPEYNQIYLKDNNQLNNDKKGGYVEVSFIDVTNNADNEIAIPQKIEAIIKKLDTNFNRNEICILVRQKKEGVIVGNYLAEKGINVVTSETLLLNNHPSVKFIIHLIKYLIDLKDEKSKVNLLYFLYDHIEISIEEHEFIKALLPKKSQDFFDGLIPYNIQFSINQFNNLPFYESIEYVCHQFKLVKHNHGYVQFFLEAILEYTRKNEPELLDFLNYWDNNKDSLSVVLPKMENAVNIMTIHKAKGLEFPVVIYPYKLTLNKLDNDYAWLPTNKSEIFDKTLIKVRRNLAEIGESGKTLLAKKINAYQFDQLNLLYVAMTRPVEQLYVVVEDTKENSKSEKISSSSDLFKKFVIKNENFKKEGNSYCLGNINRKGEQEKKEKNSVTLNEFILNSALNKNLKLLANSSVLWGTKQEKAIEYGNLIHQLLSKIKTENDIEDLIAQYENKGLIDNHKKKNVQEVLHHIVSHPKITKYFSQNATILTEKPLINSQHQVLIPDRLLFENKFVSIIDYKTGEKKESHKIQINNYGNNLVEMGFIVKEKILVYIQNKIEIVAV